MTVQPIILAAGKGTRMGNPDLPKVLTPLKGQPIISYLVKTVESCGFLPAAVVVGYHADQVRKALGEGFTYIDQKEMLGTGHAVQVCREQLAGTSDVFIVVNGDQPLWSAQTLKNLVQTHVESGAALTLATLKTEEKAFYNFGRILRDEGGEILGIREQKDCTPEELAITEYNPGLYCFSDAWLWKALEGLRPLNAQGEYYITDLLGFAVEQGEKTASLVVTKWQEALGINSPEQLRQVEEYC